MSLSPNHHLSERGRQAGKRSLRIKPRLAHDGRGTSQHVAARETSGLERNADGCGSATDAPSVDEDTEMEDVNENQRVNGSQSGNARTNKDVSGRQRSVLQDIIDEFQVGGTSD